MKLAFSRADLRNLYQRARWLGWAVSVIALAWLPRLIYSRQVELLPEEAYCWNHEREIS